MLPELEFLYTVKKMGVIMLVMGAPVYVCAVRDDR